MLGILILAMCTTARYDVCSSLKGACVLLSLRAAATVTTSSRDFPVEKDNLIRHLLHAIARIYFVLFAS